MAGIPTQALPAAMAAHERAYGAPAHVAERGGQLQRSRQLVRFVQSPWVGGIQTVARTERRLPAIFDENFVLDFGESQVPISVVAARAHPALLARRLPRPCCPRPCPHPFPASRWPAAMRRAPRRPRLPWAARRPVRFPPTPTSRSTQWA